MHPNLHDLYSVSAKNMLKQLLTDCKYDDFMSAREDQNNFQNRQFLL
jgi:hypothetical protein